jgi:hypothetical protein
MSQNERSTVYQVDPEECIYNQGKDTCQLSVTKFSAAYCESAITTISTPSNTASAANNSVTVITSYTVSLAGVYSIHTICVGGKQLLIPFFISILLSY